MVNIFKDKKFFRECVIIFVIGIIVNGACFLMGTIYSNAATLPTGSLPYNVTEYKDLNPILTDSVISALYNDSNVTSYLASCDNYIMYVDDVTNSSGRANISIRIIKNPYTDRIYDSNYDYLSQRVLYYGTWANVNVYLARDGSIYQVMWRGSNENNTSFQLLGTPVPTLNTNVNLEFTARYPFAIKSTVYDGTGNNYVFVNAVQIVPGEFTDLPGLDEILNNLNNNWEAPSSGTGHALPNQPTENPNNSDFQNRLQMFDYLKDSFNSIIGNLGYNLKNWFDNLMGKMVEGFNSVSQNIWNGFKTLMDNIKDFFGLKIDAILEILAEIRDKTGYFTEDIDSEAVADYFEENCSAFELVSAFQDFHTQLSDTFSNIVPPQRLEFFINFSNGPWPFSEVGIVSFNFDWYENIRNTIVPWILTFLYFGAIFCLGCQIPNIIHGTSGLFNPNLTGTQSISYFDTDGVYSTYDKVNTNHYSMFGGAVRFSRQTGYSSISMKNKHGLPAVRGRR